MLNIYSIQNKIPLRMKLVGLLLIGSMSIASAVSSYGQSARLSFELKNESVRSVLEKIEDQSDFSFFYDNKQINTKRLVSIHSNGEDIFSVLDELFENTDVTYKVLDKSIILSIKKENEDRAGEVSAKLQSVRKVSGVVLDQNGESVIGANVVESGTTNGTVTDIDGNFTIENVSGNMLVISYIGYKTQNFALNGKSSVQITLHEDSETLDEIVVVGYGTQKKANLSGSVGTASGKSLANRPVTNVGQALQGAVGNLNITNGTGQANSTPKFNIRGETSITGGEPLILVDNVPVTADEFSRLNAQDIDNISVLKDASSAAIYGARASFGVILVTTKKGEGEKLKINYSGNVSVNNLTNLPELELDPYTVANWKNIAGKGYYNFFDEETLEYARKRSADPSLPVAYLSSAKPETWQYLGSTNWFDEAYKKNSVSHSHNLNIAGSTDKIRYYFSAEYYNNNGILNVGSDKYNRYNLRNKLDFKVTNWLELGTNVAYTYYTNDEPYNFSCGEDDNTMFFHNLNRTSTLDVPKNEDGTWTDRGAGIVGRLADGGRSVTKSGNFQGTFSITLNLIKDILTVKGNATYKKKSLKNHNWDIPVWAHKGPDLEPSLTSHDPFTTNPFSNKYNITEDYMVYDVFANFNKKFAGNHDVSVVVGFNQEQFSYDKFLAGRDKLISTTLPSHQLAVGERTTTESLESWALRGAFYRLNYSFKNKYIVETNGRYDGSSRFPHNDRFGFFPSVSAAWVISEEQFFEPLRQVADFMKLRASYGALGNQNVGAYEYIPFMKAETLSLLLNGERPVGVNVPGLVSPALTWENVKTINGGIDLNFFSNRLTAGFDIYRRDTEGMLAKGETLPNVLGTDVPKENAANMRTNGWEMSIGWRDDVTLRSKPMNYSVRLIVADNHAVITKYANPTRSLNNYDNSSLSKREYYEGMEIGEIWGLTTLGYFQSQEEINQHADQNQVMSYPSQRPIEPGDLKFADLNNDGYVNAGKWTVDDPGDYRKIGNTTPRYNYSMDLSADWNNFDLRAFFQGVAKRDWYPNGGNHYYWGMYAQPWTNVLKSNMDYWTPENRNASLPRPKSYVAESDKELGAPQTKYLQSAAYCRLKNLTLGYTIPNIYIKKSGITNLRVYFSGENLFTIKQLPRQIDPEGLSGSIYPFHRTFSFGINLSL